MASTVFGPIVSDRSGYRFCAATDCGVDEGYPYRRYDDARHARRVTIALARQHSSAIDCHTTHEFAAAVAREFAPERAA